MKRVLGLLVLCVALGGSALTQESKEYPKFEVFGGYSFLHVDTEGVTSSSLNNAANAACSASVPPLSPCPSFNLHPNLNGWNAALHYNITRTIGLQFDVSGHYGNPLSMDSAALAFANSNMITGFPPSVHTYSFLGGPVISHRGEGFKPYIHWLIGVNHVSTGTIQNPLMVFGLPSSLSASNTAFTMALGGGLDVNLSRRFSLRVVQIDYLLTFHDPNSIANRAVGANVVSGIRTHQNNVRLSAGLVYSFGGQKGARAPRHQEMPPTVAPAAQPQEVSSTVAPAPQRQEVPPSAPAPQRQEAPPMNPPMPKPAAVGISGDTDELGGLRLTDVTAGSAAAKAGLQKNDVILRVGQYEVHTADDVARAVAAYASGTEILVEYRYLGTPGTMRTKLVAP